MSKLTKIVRVRLSDDDIKLIGNKNISAYIREAIALKLYKENNGRVLGEGWALVVQNLKLETNEYRKHKR